MSSSATVFRAGANNDALKALMADWLSEWKVLDLYKEAQSRRIPFATINTMQHLYQSEHLRDRQFFVQHEQLRRGTLLIPGMPSRYSKNQWSIRRPAPRLGEHSPRKSRAAKPGRVLPPMSQANLSAHLPKTCPAAAVRHSCAGFLRGYGRDRTCTLQLAHMGAEVIRVESTKRLCPSRLVGPFPDGKSGINRAGYFNQYNQGKWSIALDLSRPEGIEIAYELVQHADVVTDNFAAGVMERLGLGYEKISSIKPDIIQISMSAFGQTGPFKGFIGYGPPAAAPSRFSFSAPVMRVATHAKSGFPIPIRMPVRFGAFAVDGCADASRAKTGEGQFIDQSQWETVPSRWPRACWNTR